MKSTFFSSQCSARDFVRTNFRLPFEDFCPNLCPTFTWSSVSIENFQFRLNYPAFSSPTRTNQICWGSFSFDISIGSGWIPVGHLPTNFYVGFCTEFNVFRFRATCTACVLVVPCRWWTPLFETLSDVLLSSVVVILLTWLSWPTNRSILKLHCPEIPGYFASCSTIAVHSDTADRIL